MSVEIYYLENLVLRELRFVQLWLNNNYYFKVSHYIPDFKLFFKSKTWLI